MRLLFTNLSVYRAIALEALARADEDERAHRRPKPDESTGWIVTLDPARTAFKQSMIAVVFAGIYLEALIYVVGTNLLGVEDFKKVERRPLVEKVRAVGIEDAALLSDCVRFVEARNDLVHEKPSECLESIRLRTAQDEARHAIAFLSAVELALEARKQGKDDP